LMGHFSVCSQTRSLLCRTLAAILLSVSLSLRLPIGPVGWVARTGPTIAPEKLSWDALPLWCRCCCRRCLIGREWIWWSSGWAGRHGGLE
jgi:hypothetical protein